MSPTMQDFLNDFLACSEEVRQAIMVIAKNASIKVDLKVDRKAVLHALRAQGIDLKTWCKQNGYGYMNASAVMNGRNRGSYGQGREIAEKLNAIAAGVV